MGSWLRFSADMLLFYVPFINENQVACKVVTWIECLIKILTLESLHSEPEDLFNLFFDIICWLMDDIKKELKRSLLPMLRVYLCTSFFLILKEIQNLIILPPKFRERVKRILPYHGENIYSLGLDSFTFKPFDLIEDWEKTAARDRKKALNNTPISLASFGAISIRDTYEPTFRTMYDAGWRPGFAPKEEEAVSEEIGTPARSSSRSPTKSSSAKSRSRSPTKTKSWIPGGDTPASAGNESSKSPGKKRKMTDEKEDLRVLE